MFIKKKVAKINILVYQIDAMLCCIMLKFVFHIAMKVGFSKPFRFSCIAVKGEHVFNATDHLLLMIRSSCSKGLC